MGCQTRQIRFLTLATALIVAILALPCTTYAAASPVGVVNYQYLIQQHPDTAKARETMQEAIKQAQSEFDSKSAGMNDNDKNAYLQQVRQGINQKDQELIKPIRDKVDAAIKAVADAKGLSIVIDKGQVVYGGQDITEEVMNKLIRK